ncbi:MAG: ADP-ribosylglycohydrolase family protein [Bacteroidota bacterium]
MISKHLALTLLLTSLCSTSLFAQSLESRVEGLLIGSMIGDALGGPVEYRERQQSHWVTQGLKMKSEDFRTMASRVSLQAYVEPPEAYGQWVNLAPAGSVTDDSRFKFMFIDFLKSGKEHTQQAFGEYMLGYYEQPGTLYDSLKTEWLNEFASVWYNLQDAGHPKAKPRERVWGGIPTMAGQMPFLPLASLYPGNPEEAYLATWKINSMDNGVAMDVTSALVAGLSTALVAENWEDVFTAMRTTDPFGYAEVPWVPRRFNEWMDQSISIAERAEGSPSRLFEILEQELNARTWWETWVPVVISFSCLHFAEYNGLAAMQLTVEFGYDTDSAAQLLGAFVGAMHGGEVFADRLSDPVKEQLTDQYQVDFDKLVQTLLAAKPIPSE